MPAAIPAVAPAFVDVGTMSDPEHPGRPRGAAPHGAAAPSKPPRKPAAPVTDDDADLIGANLRRLFGAVEQEELPDRFKALLRQLAEEDRSK